MIRILRNAVAHRGQAKPLAESGEYIPRTEDIGSTPEEATRNLEDVWSQKDQQLPPTAYLPLNKKKKKVP